MILLPVVGFVVLVLALSAGTKGPLWAMSIAWLVSLVPITSGLMTFATLTDPGFSYSLTLIALIASYAGGAALFHLVPRAPSAPQRPVSPRMPPLTIAWTCWAVGLVGAACVVVDFALLGGAGLSDLAALRDTYVEKTAASVYAQVGSVMTWGCLYSFIFALLYRQRLRPVRTLILMTPIAGYFLISLLSAGRQAAFQVMLATVLTVATAAARRRARKTTGAERTNSRWLIVGVSAAMIGYMGYIAVSRNDGSMSNDKTDVLLALFDFRMSPTLQAIGEFIGPTLRAVVVEALTYFSSSIAIFQKFLLLDPPIGFGANSLPFIMRQLQSLTGVSPAVQQAARIESLNALGVVGNGWTTAFSSYLADFGTAGTVAFLAVAGYYSSWAWRRALVSDHFEDVAIGIVVLLFAIYMPLSPVLSDTNILLLWLMCLAIKVTRTQPGMSRSKPAMPVAA